MSTERPWSWQLEHIVFPGAGRGGRSARNLGPAPTVAAEEPSAPSAVASEDGEPFLTWLFSQAGLSAWQYRPETLHRRLPACLRLLHARSPDHARELLEQSPGLLPSAVSALLVGVTAFFRDTETFCRLRTLLPEVVGGRKAVNVWSAGCSDGAELYSVAMLLADAGLTAGYLLGTDCRSDALQAARAARYDTSSIKAVPEGLLHRFFRFRGGAWEIDAALRRTIRWRTGDVLNAAEPGVWDLILFRNTAMYLRAEAAYPLWLRLEQALRPGGLLVLGKAERPAGASRLTPVGPCLFRRTRR
jgi:chemotaxis methyl-accepting protein methylase